MWYIILAKLFPENEKVEELGWKDDFGSFLWHLSILSDEQIVGYIMIP